MKRFGRGVLALDAVSFGVATGEMVGVAGANGSGKSTLLKALFGIVAPDGGTLRVLELDPRADRRRLRARAGYAAQEAALDPEMTGWETLRLFDALFELPSAGRAARLDDAAAGHGLAEFCARPVGTWSGGERQRLNLALASLHAPELLLLDEPTAALDPRGRRELWARLSAWRDAGRTIIVASHDLGDVAAHCDRVLVMRAGRVAAYDTPAALVAAHARARTTITLAAPIDGDDDAARAALAALPGAPEVEVRGETITLWRAANPDGAEPALAVLAARGIRWVRWEREEPDLAAAFFRLTGASPDAADRPGVRGRGGGGGRGRGGGSAGSGAGLGSIRSRESIDRAARDGSSGSADPAERSGSAESGDAVAQSGSADVARHPADRQARGDRDAATTSADDAARAASTESAGVDGSAEAGSAEGGRGRG